MIPCINVPVAVLMATTSHGLRMDKVKNVSRVFTTLKTIPVCPWAILKWEGWAAIFWKTYCTGPFLCQFSKLVSPKIVEQYINAL